MDTQRAYDFINPFFEPFSAHADQFGTYQIFHMGTDGLYFNPTQPVPTHVRKTTFVMKTARASQKCLHHFLLRSTNSLNTTLSTTFLSNSHVLLLPALPRIPSRWCCISYFLPTRQFMRAVTPITSFSANLTYHFFVQGILGESLWRPRNINQQGPSIHFTRPCSILRARRLQHLRSSLPQNSILQSHTTVHPSFTNSASWPSAPDHLKPLQFALTMRALLHSKSEPEVHLHLHFAGAPPPVTAVPRSDM